MNNKEIINFCYKWKDAREALDYIEMGISIENNEFIVHIWTPTKRKDINNKYKILHYKKLISLLELKRYNSEELFIFLHYKMNGLFYEFIFTETQTETYI